MIACGHIIDNIISERPGSATNTSYYLFLDNTFI